MPNPLLLMCGDITTSTGTMPERIDKALAARGLSESREKARRELLAGWVKVNGETVREPSRQVKETDEIEVSRPGGLFVSRGGEKLARALEVFKLDLTGMTAVDLGASTGGFTDCMLKNGASIVYAIDVGYGQLDYRLRTDERVIVMERTNARNLTPENFAHQVDFVTADLSFISIQKVFPVIRDLFSPVQGVLLIKPQFEAMPGEHKKGVVTRSEAHVLIVRRTLEALVSQGLVVRGLDYSPVKGPKGNIEFLLWFSVNGAEPPAVDGLEIIEQVVAHAHSALDD